MVPSLLDTGSSADLESLLSLEPCGVKSVPLARLASLTRYSILCAALGDILTMRGVHDTSHVVRGFGGVMSVQAMSLVGKFFRLPRQDGLLLVEAALWLAIAGFAIAVLPFRQVVRLAARPIRRSEPTQQSRLRDVKRIRWAIVATASRVPWHAMCFQQGLAAQFMLRRRGIPALLLRRGAG
jgi:Transglutaminase-like superfamily